MNDEYIINFYNEIKQSLEGKYKIILEPNRNLKNEWIEYDQVKWELEEPIQNLVTNLKQMNSLNFEEKLLKVYQFICLNYIYDDNVLYFFKKDVENNKYIAVDWYGRIVDDNWKENRKKHNRRVCYEFARFFAKAINELIDKKDELEAFMVGDKENLHYVVGLTGEDYSIILDLDDFNKIKDLTRLKLGLTINGIKILRDNLGKFQKAIDKFNENKPDDLDEIKELKKNHNDTIKFFRKTVEILNNYKIDSQGFMEYMRSIIENEHIEIEKIWKEVKSGAEKRYVRCLIFDFDNKSYLIDSVEHSIELINKTSLDKTTFIFHPEENVYPYFGG